MGLNLVRVSVQTDKEVKKKHTPETCHHTQGTTQVFLVRANDKKHPHNAACITWTKYITMSLFFLIRLWLHLMAKFSIKCPLREGLYYTL